MALKNCLQKVFGNEGFSVGRVSNSDLQIFRSIVQKHYYAILSSKVNSRDAQLLEIPIWRYHENVETINHSTLWGKRNRILSVCDYQAFLQSDFFVQLREDVGEIYISDEEDIGYPEIYWRLVRPQPYNDIGPLHADAWYWELGHGCMPEGYHRVKFWFSLWNEKGRNGFRFVSGSHQRSFEYKSETRDGILKPVFDEHKHDLEISIFQSDPGDFIIFNDQLLHGGLYGGKETRVSFEFCLFLPVSYVEDELCFGGI